MLCRMHIVLGAMGCAKAVKLNSQKHDFLKEPVMNSSRLYK